MSEKSDNEGCTEFGLFSRESGHWLQAGPFRTRDEARGFAAWFSEMVEDHPLEVRERQGAGRPTGEAPDS